MLKNILNLLVWIAKFIAESSERHLGKARKSYASWRAGFELRREKRLARADLLESVDKLPDGQLPGGK